MPRVTTQRRAALIKKLAALGKEIAIFVFSLGAAFIFFVTFMVVRGAFEEATRLPPDEPALLEALDTGRDYQEKNGSLEVENLWIGAQKRWATQFFRQIKMKSKSTGDGPESAVAYCDPGYKLVGCSGALDRRAEFQCSEKSKCGLVGVIPVDESGKRATATATGCKTTVDGDGGNTEAVAFAYCVQGNF